MSRPLYPAQSADALAFAIKTPAAGYLEIMRAVGCSRWVARRAREDAQAALVAAPPMVSESQLRAVSNAGKDELKFFAPYILDEARRQGIIA